jgi:hypothetical protein
MRLISFDVGIKNMAYCIFDVHPNDSNINVCQDISDKRFTIVDWNVLNLLSIPEEPEPCSYMLDPPKKKAKLSAEKTPCGKKSKYFKSDCYYCETHAKKQTKYCLPIKEKYKSMKNEDLSKLITRLSPFTDISKMKKVDMISFMDSFCQTRCLEKVGATKSVKAGEIDLITIGKSIKQALDQISSNLEEITHVIIENQISTIATRMKTIQGMLAQYFIMRNPADTHIEFVSSHNKLKGFVLDDTICDQPKYKQNKQNGLAICNQFMEINPDSLESWKPKFSDSKKKDDLADCFLQGIWYLKSKKIISYAENLKINIV